MNKLIPLLSVVAAVSAVAQSPAGRQAFPPAGGTVLDKGAFAEWLDGKEVPVLQSAAKDGPKSVVWGPEGKPEWTGVKFGEGRAAGVRHLRIGFTEGTAAGSVLVRGGGALSVLKADAAYPGNLADDSQWIAAERLVEGKSSGKEAGPEDYALWVLPPGTKTRALRFSHVPAPGDRELSGWLGGVWMLEERLGNVAPQSLVQSAARDDVSAKLVNETNDRQWSAWDNGEKGAAQRITESHPEWITFTWPRVVTLRGLCLLWTGFSAADVESFNGGEGENVREAPASRWNKVASASGMDALYPMAVGPHWLAFDKTISTRALRLRITAGAVSGHSHLADKVKEGRRVWLGEAMALAPLPDKAALTSLVLPKTAEEPPPIPVKFTLPEAGLVTLVIEDQQNKRVRNLVSETPFPAGPNTAWWDASDDLLRDPEAARHGVYNIPSRPVAPGTYKVRGLWHRPLQLHYEFSIYNAGKPAWETADKTGCWLTTHTPPTSLTVVPGSRTADGQPLIFMGAFVAEGGHGLQWLHEDGTKLGGQGWIGGNWTGAPTLTCDTGAKALPDHLCYAGSIWEGELRLTAKTRNFSDKPVLKLRLGPEKEQKKGVPELKGFDGGDKTHVLGGIAAHDGILVCSMVRQNELLVVNIADGKIISRPALENPRGLAFDSKGRLLALSGTSLVRFADLSGKAETVIAKGLEDPRHVAVDAAGGFFITDRGASHQVKVFSAAGKLTGTIGKAGLPAAGLYDPDHLNNPNGLAVDTAGRVWVAEADNHPRRVSVWSPGGKLERAFYGPTEYGGGGMLDPRDRTKFYYKGMEFKLDWDAGKDTLVRVFARPESLPHGHYGPYSPDTPLYPEAGKGTRYFTSCYTHNPTNGDDVAFLWQDGDQTVRMVAALGNAHSWPVLCGEAFRPSWPEGTKPEKENAQQGERATFAWSDTNRDGQPQPGEVKFVKTPCQGVTVMNDLSFVITRMDKQAVRFVPEWNAGVPAYEVTKPQVIGPRGGDTPSSGGNQALNDAGGWAIYTNAPEPFSPYGLGGAFRGEPRWSYPSPWPGLHASHEAAVPDRPGMVVGHTRLLGGLITGKAGPMFCLNGNMGNMYLFTADGLFVSTLFHDIRLRPNWAAPVATRNMDVTDVSLHDENFWPGITQTADGKVYLVDGGRTSLVRVDGLETLTLIPEQTVTVTEEDLRRSRDWLDRAESRRQQERGRGTLNVVQRKSPPQVDGRLEDWQAADWAFIDRRGTKANFDSNSRPYEVSAAVVLNETHLFAAWRTTEKDLLNNSGETANALFKHGGCLDIMLRTEAGNGEGGAAGAGDERLLVTQVKGQTRALLYRAKVAGTAEPVSFSSPWRTIKLDAVEDVSSSVTLAMDKQGNYEISVPLSTLHWQPKTGATYRADLGVLRGRDGHTTQRVYWNNKATAITADVPSEAELTPKLWGLWNVVAE